MSTSYGQRYWLKFVSNAGEWKVHGITAGNDGRSSGVVTMQMTTVVEAAPDRRATR
jgi:hypothetical protein